MPQPNRYEQQFLTALKAVFIGAEVEGDSGYINLMRIKARYFEEGVFPQLQRDIDAACQPFAPGFREELFDKLYDFFARYFSESGSIYFRHTAPHQRVYERVYTDDRDVMLFWKTHMLYYVKTDRLFKSMEATVDGRRFFFDVGGLEHKRANEKRALVYTFARRDADDRLVFTVAYAEKGSKTKTDDVLKAVKQAGSVLDEETFTKACRIFEQQSEVDYFINKDARAFLREQFDLWLYQYLFQGENRFDATRLATPDRYFVDNGARRYGRFDVLLPRLAAFFGLAPQAVEGFKPLTDEINHFQHLRVRLENIDALRQKIAAVQAYQDPSTQKAQLKERVVQGTLDLDAYTAAIEALAHTADEAVFTPPHAAPLTIKHIAAHYYLPILLADDEKIAYINHILRVPGEVHFIRQLADYVEEPDNRFRRYDWWMFSRTDETTDRVILPYYDPLQNRIRDFHPDFVFWLVRGAEYTILFVDPKGMIASNYQHKVEDYKRLFRTEDGGYRTFVYHDYRVRVALAMFNPDASAAVSTHAGYWFDHIHTLLQSLQ